MRIRTVGDMDDFLVWARRAGFKSDASVGDLQIVAVMPMLSDPEPSVHTGPTYMERTYGNPASKIQVPADRSDTLRPESAGDHVGADRRGDESADDTEH